MGALVIFIIVVLVFGLPALTSGQGVRAIDRLIARGIPARGLVLSVSQTGTAVSYGTRRFERRNVLLDVEIHGQAPYQLQLSPLIPKQLVRRVLPGSFLELRVDPKRATNVVVVGPGSVFFVE